MASLNFRYPDKPILTTKKVVAGLCEKEWICNAKYDGWRMPICFIRPGEVECFTSSGNRMELNTKFDPEILQQLKEIKLPELTIIDSELIGPRGHLDSAIYLFDVLAWDGEWLCDEPYETRWQRCLSVAESEDIHHAESRHSGFLDYFEELKSAWDGDSLSLHEGIVIKDRLGTIKLSRRSSQKNGFMLKLRFRNIRQATAS